MAPVGFDAEVGDGGAAEAAALAPPATGLLVTQVLPGSAAADAGLRPGDVIIGYAGRAVSGIDGLVQALRAGDDGAGRVVLTYVNASGQRAAEVAAGRLGVGGIDVVKGEPRQLRPPATGVAFDFADLDHRPREAWFAFAIDGGHVGFEHHRLRRVGDALLLRSEVAFRHEQWGRQHFIVQTEALADGEATLTRSRYASAPNGFRCDLRVERSGEGTAMVVVDQLMGDERETSRVPVSGAQSDYLATQLAAWMPREAGACWHYEMINLADGSPLGKSSLFVNGRETIEVDGEPVEAWRVEQHTMGKPGRVSWVDGDGRAFRHDYGGGATATRTARAAALAGLPNDIRPIDAAPTGPTIGRDE